MVTFVLMCFDFIERENWGTPLVSEAELLWAAKDMVADSSFKIWSLVLNFDRTFWHVLVSRANSMSFCSISSGNRALSKCASI